MVVFREEDEEEEPEEEERMEEGRALGGDPQYACWVAAGGRVRALLGGWLWRVAKRIGLAMEESASLSSSFLCKEGSNVSKDTEDGVEVENLTRLVTLDARSGVTERERRGEGCAVGGGDGGKLYGSSRVETDSLIDYVWTD